MIQVNQDACIACGLCFGTHPEFFAFAANGKAEAIKQPTTDEEKATVQEAIDNCPVGAISDEKVVEMHAPSDEKVVEMHAPQEDMPMAA